MLPSPPPSPPPPPGKKKRSSPKRSSPPTPAPASAVDQFLASAKTDPNYVDTSAADRDVCFFHRDCLDLDTACWDATKRQWTTNEGDDVCSVRNLCVCKKDETGVRAVDKGVVYQVSNREVFNVLAQKRRGVAEGGDMAKSATQTTISKAASAASADLARGARGKCKCNGCSRGGRCFEIGKMYGTVTPSVDKCDKNKGKWCEDATRVPTKQWAALPGLQPRATTNGDGSATTRSRRVATQTKLIEMEPETAALLEAGNMAEEKKANNLRTQTTDNTIYDTSTILSYKNSEASLAGGIMFDGRQLSVNEDGTKGVQMGTFINCDDSSQSEVCLSWTTMTINQVHVYSKDPKCCDKDAIDITQCTKDHESCGSILDIRKRSNVAAVFGVCRYGPKWSVQKVKLNDEFINNVRSPGMDAYTQGRLQGLCCDRFRQWATTGHKNAMNDQMGDDALKARVEKMCPETCPRGGCLYTSQVSLLNYPHRACACHHAAHPFHSFHATLLHSFLRLFLYD